jgi:hypothetical protein
MKTTYADGDVYAAGDVNDITGTINLLGSSVAYAAGKNRIINGDFFVNQRNFTSSTTSGVYTFDRWRTEYTNGTVTYSSQTLTQSTGLLPLAGLSGSSFLRIVTSGHSAVSDFCGISQRIENAATFQGQTVTVSFYAKAASGTPKVSVNLAKNQPTVGQVSQPIGFVTLSTSWARYSLTATVSALANAYTPSGSFLEAYFITSAGANNATFASSIGSQNATIDFWGIQIEPGSTATAFQTATGTIASELAACMRYFEVVTAYDTSVEFPATLQCYSTTKALGSMLYKVTKRAVPIATISAVGHFQVRQANAVQVGISSAGLNPTNIRSLIVEPTSSGLVAGNATVFESINSNGYIWASAEL